MPLWELALTPAPDKDYLYHVAVASAACVFFLTLHVCIHVVCMLFNNHYKNLFSEKRAEYRSYIVSMVNSFISTSVAWVAIFCLCADEWSVFNSPECFNTPLYYHIWAVGYINAYFMLDFVLVFFVMQGRSLFDLQVYAHHALFISSFYLTLYFMNYLVVIGVTIMLTEVSSAWLSLRWLMFTHKKDKSLFAFVNLMIVFFTFLFGRVVFQAIVLLAMGLPLWINQWQHEDLSSGQKVMLSWFFLAMVLSIIMNWFWMYLVYKQAKRAINKRFGVPAQTDTDDNFGKPNLTINADNCVETSDSCVQPKQGLLQ